MPKTYIGDDAVFVMSFKENLRDILEERKIKKSDLAKRIVVSPNMIGEYLRGTNKPTDEVLCKLSLVLRCSVDDLTRIRPEFKNL